jgi:putative hemolysin
VCDHLVVFCSRSGELAGTYRLQTGAAATDGLGFYSEQEFDFSPFSAERGLMIEIGRACVHHHHRNLAALGMLWKGIARYAQERAGRFLIGCSSLSTVDPAEGWSVYARLARNHLAPPERRTRPLAGWECPPADPPDAPCAVPKLMSAYLGLGAEICGPPAIDRRFGTIDFLTVLDLEALHPAARRRFLS